jgi:serine/threonine protein phosphatase PrpC
LERADTIEQSAQDATINGGSPTSAPVIVQFEMPPLDELARATAEGDAAFPFGPGAGPDDALPWPLPPTIIVGGRYRVERLISPPAATAEDENQYIVADLQGYERCWSCGKSNGAEAARDTYCQSCGADMLAREYVMTERMLPADDETTGDAAGDVDGDSGKPGPGADDAPERSEKAEAATDESTVSEGDTAPTEDAASGADTREFVQGKRAYRVTPRVIEQPAFPLGARVVVATATDVGRTRMGEHNEDSVAALVVTLGYDSRTLPLALGLVADGLGGHANGQDASRLVAKSIAEQIVKSVAAPFTTLPPSALEGESGLDQALLEAARAANAKLCAENQQTGGDMGSTLVAALVCGDTAFVVNVGDSRAYVFDGGELRRLTTDHSLVEQLIQSGLVTPEDRYTHPKRNQIFRSLGDDPNMPIDLFSQKLTAGMRLLLCSDGLWEMAHDDQMRDILAQTAAPHAACDALIRAANENGGEDNISCVLIDVSA